MLVSLITLQASPQAFADFPVHTAGTRLAQPTTLRTSVYFAVDSNGNYFINDSKAFIKKLDSSGNFVTQFGAAGTGAGQFANAGSVGEMAVDSSGNLYVVDISNNRVNKFSNTGAFISSFGSAGAGNGQFNSPNSIAIDSNDAIYVTDVNNSRVQKFTSAGVFVLAFGSAGDLDGQFRGPKPIAIDAANNVYVSDTSGTKVRAQKFTSTGAHVTTYLGEGTGAFCSGPGGHGMALDSSNNLYLATVGTLCGSNVHKYSNDGTRLADLPLDLANRRIKIYNDVMFTSNNYGSNAESIVKYTLAGTLISQLPLSNAPGKFKLAGAAAQDSDGNTYVIDTDNDRIQKFDTNGTFVMQFGSTGTGNGQFGVPYDITITPDNTIYVTDSSRRIVQRFNSSGVYLSQFTLDPLGITGSSTYAAIDNDSAGNIYVLSKNYQVVMMAGDGTPIRQVTVAGSLTSQISSSFGLSVGPDDTIYVSTSSLIKLYTSAGTYLRNVNARLNDAENSGTTKIDVDTYGNIYMLREFSKSYAVSNNAGTFLYRVNATNAVTGFTLPLHLSIGNNNKLIISDGHDYVQTYDANTIATSPSAPQNLTASLTPTGEALLSWQAPTSDNGSPILKYKIEFKSSLIGTWTEFALTTDGTARQWKMSGLTQDTYDFRVSATNLAGTGTAASVLGYALAAPYTLEAPFLTDTNNAPAGMAIDAAGNRYVTDEYNHRVMKYDATGNLIMQFGTYGTAAGSGLLYRPTAIAVDAAGDIYVANTGNDRVEKFSATGIYITTIGARGTLAGQFGYPNDLTLDGNGNLYVVDGWKKIEKFTTDGVYVGSFAPELSSPTSMTIDRTNGDIYIANYPTSPQKGVYRYTNTGTQLASFGTEGQGDAQTYDEMGIAIDSFGRVIVSDTYNYRLLMYTKDGTYLGQLGRGATYGWGTGPLQFDEPTLITVASDGKLYVADRYNNHFVVFGSTTAVTPTVPNEPDPTPTPPTPPDTTVSNPATTPVTLVATIIDNLRSFITDSMEQDEPTEITSSSDTESVTVIDGVVKLTWIVPDTMQPDEFLVQYRTENETIWTDSERLPSTSRAATIDDLLPGTYAVRVLAVFNDGTESKEVLGVTTIVIEGDGDKTGSPVAPASSGSNLSGWIFAAIAALTIATWFFVLVAKRRRRNKAS